MLVQINEASNFMVLIPYVEADQRKSRFDTFDSNGERRGRVRLVREDVDCVGRQG